MRRKALFGVPRPSDHDLDRCVLSLPYDSDKGGSDRRFPLTPMACDLIRALPAQPGERMFIWTSKQGRHDYRSFYHESERMQRKAGIMGADQSRLHVLRKTSLTHMAEAGVQMATLQQHAGHSSIEITSKYYLAELTSPRRDAVKGLMVPEKLGKEVQKKLFD